MFFNVFFNLFRRFFTSEPAGGILLIGAMLLALFAANSSFETLYAGFLDTPVVVQVGALILSKPLLLWINDGLMAVFFLLIGLEVKREILVGELSSLPKVALPGIAALGGMVVPALVFVLFTFRHPDLLAGWAIPAATDIAFALGVMALLGPRVPASLKLFLMALAILDDLGAIVIIAIFYTADLSTSALGLAGIFVALLVILNRMGVRALSPYLVVGTLLWVAVLKSGVHATLAGVVVALAIPMGPKKGEEHSPAGFLEHALHSWVTFIILPLFAFANAGVPLTGLTIDHLLAPLPLGIAAGLFIGKQVGIFGFSWVGVKLGLAKLPEGVTWRSFHGMAVLCGIGFTMSLFIATLALEHADTFAIDGARVGILLGSFLSAIIGAMLLIFSGKNSNK